MFDSHYEKTLIKQYKSGFKTFLQMRSNLGYLEPRQKELILSIFDKIVTVKNIKTVANNSFFYNYNLFKKALPKK